MRSLRLRRALVRARDIVAPSFPRPVKQNLDLFSKALAFRNFSNHTWKQFSAPGPWFGRCGLCQLSGARRPGVSLGFIGNESQRLQIPALTGWDIDDVWKARPRRLPLPPVFAERTPTERSAAIIDGLKIAKEIKDQIAEEVRKMKESDGRVPGLAVVLVGNRKDSEAYVRNKKMGCDEVGIQSFGVHLPEEASEEQAIDHIRKYNSHSAVHGLLVQLPLPKHINEERVLSEVSLEKDVDGFHPLNIGRLAMHGREPLFVPCTPKGCLELLLRSGVHLEGQHAVVIGRSNIVGIPAAMLLQRHNMTVTVVHEHTLKPEEVTRSADIVIVAVGVPNLVRGDWLKPGAVVLDVGINPIEDSTAERGYRLVGDVCYEEAVKVASAITPVPGGVGPMTIAMLLANTIHSAKRAYGMVSN